MCLPLYTFFAKKKRRLGTQSAIPSYVKLQLTRTKTIEIAFPLRRASKGHREMTGVELFPTDGPTCPAVRIARKKGVWHLLAADRVPALGGEMPERWEDVAHQPTWGLPRDFQSPHAALAVNSAQGSFGQASSEAIVQEMMHGPATPAANEPPKPAAGASRLKIKRAEAPSAPKPAKAEPAPNARRPELPPVGRAVSENGRRFTLRPFGEEGFHLCASLPEYQALWLSRLLPEGRRPTACSVQLAESALMASILAQPEFVEDRGTALAVFVRAGSIHLAGYRNGTPVLWRACPGARGENAMRAAVKRTLGVEDELIDSVLEDALIDPRPALEPFVHPILEQLELSRAYLAGKHGMKIERVFLMGLSAGAGQWSRLSEESLHLPLVAPDPFAGFIPAKGVDVARPQDYLVALGAALAAMEVDA